MKNLSQNKRHKTDKLREQTINTVQALLPIWCDNIVNNIPYIKRYGSLSKLLCRSYPKCWKLDKLKEYFFASEEYDVRFIEKECGLSKEIILQIGQLFLMDTSTLSGTSSCDGCKDEILIKKPVLIIGGGPSLDTYNHLELLKKYGFNGDIFCVSSILKKVLEYGIIPNYVVSIDAENHDTMFLEHEIIKEHSDKITGIFSVTVHPSTNECFKGNRYFIQGYINPETAPNVGHMIYLFTNVLSIVTCGNVGSSCITLASSMGYNPIITIGLDLSFPTEKELKHYYDSIIHTWDKRKKEIDWNLPEYKYKHMINPDFNKEYYIDKTFESYAISTKEIIYHLSSVNKLIINCTEQGALHSKHIKAMKFIDYLENQCL